MADALAMPPPPEGQTYAVIVYCNGEKRSPFAPIAIPLDHPCFDLAPAPTSALFEFPIVVYKTNSLPSSTPRHLLDNQIATFLMINPDNGFAPPQWQSMVGTCIVARKDKKSLDLRHFEGIWQYNDHILDRFGDGQSPEEMKENGIYSKEGFVEWFDNYMWKMKENDYGVGWDTCPPLF